MKRIPVLISLVVTVVILLTACGGQVSAPKDLLARIKQRGYIIISSDPDNAPQSTLNTQGKRPSNTKCPLDTLTTAEMQGFDVDVAAEIGKRLGVETCFATPSWDMITAGSWAGKWDLSIGSMTITTTRAKVLTFTVPYYYYAVIAVKKGSGIKTINDLSGQLLCAGASTTYESWLTRKGFDLPASDVFMLPPANVKEVPLDTDQECAQAIDAGRNDFVGYVTPITKIEQNIAAGIPVVQLDGPIFRERLAGAVDKSSSLPIDTFVTALNAIITAMHSDGTLTQFSMQWFQADLTQAPK
ncbi:MAG: transporter substrate-binding domain-containing protein [Anaerolineales bacterium]|jgi:polar amino acid transport system substrate-binding protein